MCLFLSGGTAQLDGESDHFESVVLCLFQGGFPGKKTGSTRKDAQRCQAHLPSTDP